jgi:hypothetical protein
MRVSRSRISVSLAPLRPRNQAGSSFGSKRPSGAGAQAVARQPQELLAAGGRVVARQQLAILGLRREAGAAAARGPGAAALEVELDAHGPARVELRRRVHDHEPGDALGMSAREQHGDAPAQRMADQDEALDPERGGHRLEVRDVEVVVVAGLGVAIRVPVPAQVEGQRAVVRRHGGGEVVPHVGLVAEAVHEQQGDALAAPLEHVQGEAVGGRNADRGGLHARRA